MSELILETQGKERKGEKEREKEGKKLTGNRQNL